MEIPIYEYLLTKQLLLCLQEGRHCQTLVEWFLWLKIHDLPTV